MQCTLAEDKLMKANSTPVSHRTHPSLEVMMIGVLPNKTPQIHVSEKLENMGIRIPPSLEAVSSLSNEPYSGISGTKVAAGTTNVAGQCSW